MRVFVEGEAHKEATKDRPWFDPDKPISVRASYLTGEKISKGKLPITMNLMADSWLLQLKMEETALKGYVNVSISKCSIN